MRSRLGVRISISDRQSGRIGRLAKWEGGATCACLLEGRALVCLRGCEAPRFGAGSPAFPDGAPAVFLIRMCEGAGRDLCVQGG